MTIVTLKDETTYYVDTDSIFKAKEVVSYKLRDKLDFREIASVDVIEGLYINKNSPYYNSSNRSDGKELKAKTGIAYK